VWIVEFCARHSSDCVQMAEECTEAERRRAWLELAQRWVQVADDARASNRRDKPSAADRLDGDGSGPAIGFTP
jgi:hypothetical protein